MISFETVKEKVEELGYKIELKNNGVQFYIKCKNGAVNYYPKNDKWVDDKNKSHTNLNKMLQYLKANTARLLPEYKMCKFNLEKALNGKAFYLQNGYRGVIKYGVEDRVTDTGYAPDYPYVGYILDSKGFIYKTLASWDKDGKSNILADYSATTMVEDNTHKQEEKTMKPFDLEKALQGEPVLLRDGRKGIVFYRIPDQYKFPIEGDVLYKLRGITLNKEGFIDDPSISWTLDGVYDKDFDDSRDDIIGMWVEPKLTTPELMEKALNENLTVKAKSLGKNHKGFKVIAKTKDGSDYVLRSSFNSGELFMQSVITRLEHDWSIV